MIHDLRAMCDAVSYVVKNEVEWRALPADFPDREAYAFWERWNGRGLPLELREHRIGLLVTTNSGGAMTAGRLWAAREHRRDHTVPAALSWISRDS